MNISIQKTAALPKTKILDLLIIPVVRKRLPKSLARLKNLNLVMLKHHLELDDLKAKPGSYVIFYPGLSEGVPARRVALVEMGGDKPAQTELEETFKNLAGVLRKAKTTGMVLSPGSEKFVASWLIVVLYRLLYEFHEHRSKVEDDEKNKLDELILFSDSDLKREVAKAQIVGEAVWLVRNLANHPANVMTPKFLAGVAQTQGRQHGFGVKILGEKDMEKLGMGGILGVSRGSDEEAQLIVLDYHPKGKKSAGKKSVGLVGKGVTFDSGGISIKPSKDMHEMKFDMAGGATVLALVQIASRLKLPFRIIGAIAATENLPSGKAIKPGDVVKTYSGKTVEVINTDAEGRIVLSDALTYVQRNYHPQLIIDLATLTGAIIVALGNKITGAFGNSEKFNQQLLAASRQAGEPIHFMPLFPKYAEDLKSKIADMANIGKQRVDATIGALFIKEFIEDNTPWIHLDIAGTASDPDGATGVMIATLAKFLERIKF